MQEAAKHLLRVLVARFSIVDPLGGNPFFLALTRKYAPEARTAFVLVHRRRQFCFAGWLVFCGDVRARLFCAVELRPSGLAMADPVGLAKNIDLR